MWTEVKGEITGDDYLAMSFRENRDTGSQRYSGVLIGGEQLHFSTFMNLEMLWSASAAEMLLWQVLFMPRRGFTLRSH